MEILEDRIPLWSGKMIDRSNRAFAVVDAKVAPGGKQSCRKIRNRPPDRLRQVPPRGHILLALERIHTKHQAGDAITLVSLSYAFGELDRFVDITIDQGRQEGSIEQFAVARIALECGSVVGGSGSRIALLAGVARGKITTRSANSTGLQGAGLLRGKRGRRSRQKGGQRAAGSAAAEARRGHGRCSNEAVAADLLANHRMLYREWPFCAAPARTSRAARLLPA